MPLLHAAALARELNVSKMAISRAQAEGLLTPAGKSPTGKPLFDLEEVRRVYAPDPLQTERPDGLKGGRPRYKKSYKSDRVTFPVTNPPPAPVAVPPPPSGQPGPDTHEDDKAKMLKARAAHLETQSQLAAIKLRLQRGELIEKEEVRRQGSELGAVLMGAIQAFPDRHADALAVLSDRHDVHNFLVKHLNEMIIQIRAKCGAE